MSHQFEVMKRNRQADGFEHCMKTEARHGHFVEATAIWDILGAIRSGEVYMGLIPYHIDFIRFDRDELGNEKS
jgi:hypothetical protein